MKSAPWFARSFFPAALPQLFMQSSGVPSQNRAGAQRLSISPVQSQSASQQTLHTSWLDTLFFAWDLQMQSFLETCLETTFRCRRLVISLRSLLFTLPKALELILQVLNAAECMLARGELREQGWMENISSSLSSGICGTTSSSPRISIILSRGRDSVKMLSRCYSCYTIQPVWKTSKGVADKNCSKHAQAPIAIYARTFILFFVRLENRTNCHAMANGKVMFSDSESCSGLRKQTTHPKTNVSLHVCEQQIVVIRFRNLEILCVCVF